jgi:hypothetical protein
MAIVRIHPRVSKRHPEVSGSDVLTAWSNLICRTRRTDAYDDNFIAVGFDPAGRLLEMVAIQTNEDEWLVFHAMPATNKALAELGLI